MSAILTTISDSNKNITTELLIGTYQASGEKWVSMQPRLSSLNGAAAVITYRLEHTASDDTVLSYRADSFSGSKNAAANTTFGERALGPVLLADGEKLKLYALSTNASDTAVTVSIRVLDVCTLLSNQDKTNYSLVSDYDAAKTAASQTTTDEILSKVNSIGSGTGAALNFSASSSNVASPIKGVTFVGVQSSGTYLSTAAEDSVRHQITHVGNAIDIVYQFNIGSGRNAAKVTFKGYVSGSNDTITVQAYNGSTWDTRTTIVGQTATTNITKDITLLSMHTGTGADAGNVFIRLVCTGMTAPVLYVDELLVSGVSVGMTTGYSDGSVWVKASGTSGTTPFINGTADNPCPWADALTIANSVGLTRFRIINSETITLTESLTNKSLIGKSWYINLNGQEISGSYFEGCRVVGTSTGSSNCVFIDCSVGNGLSGGSTIPPSTFYRCGFNTPSGYAFYAASSGEYSFIDCYSLVAGSATPYFNFTNASSSSGFNFRRWSGGSNVTMNSYCTCTMEVITGGGQTFSTGGGSLEIRGICRSVSVTLGTATSETVQIDSVSGPITISGSPTNASVNIYGICGNATSSLSGATITNHAVSHTSIQTKASDALLAFDSSSGVAKQSTLLDVQSALSGDIGGFTETDRSMLENTYDLVADSTNSLNDIDLNVVSIKTVTDKLDTAIVQDGIVYKFTENALEDVPVAAVGGFEEADRTVLEDIQTKINDHDYGLSTISADIATASSNVDSIKEQTDKLVFTGNDVNATLDGETVTVSNTTGYTLTSAYDAAKSAASQTSVNAIDATVGSIKLKTDNLPNDPASNTQVNTRLASEDYVPLEQDDTIVLAIKEQTDKLSFTGNDVKATLDGESVIVSNTTGYTLTSAYDAAKSAASQASVDSINAAICDSEFIENIVSGLLGAVIEESITLQEATKRLLSCLVNSCEMTTDDDGNKIFTYTDSEGSPILTQTISPDGLNKTTGIL